MSTKFFTRYSVPDSPVTVLDYETKTVDQSEADMCGLHYQLQRYGLDGLQARFEAMKDKFGYADTRAVPSFAELQNRIVKGNEYFNNLPAEIRAKFGNNSAKFYTYLEENPEQAVKDGYIHGMSYVDIKPGDEVQPVEPPKSIENQENQESEAKVGA